jgi:hypothetical protein
MFGEKTLPVERHKRLAAADVLRPATHWTIMLIVSTTVAAE